MTDCLTCRERLKFEDEGKIFPCPTFSAVAENEYYPLFVVETYFCRHHVMWLLRWYGPLSEATYPPKQTGYVPQPGYRSGDEPVAAPTEKVSALYVMLSVKLEATGEDGQTLLDEVEHGVRWPFARAALKALNYISGPKVRRESYRSFKNRHRKPTNVGISSNT